VSDARQGAVRRLGRRPEFNGLRGIWILAIIVFHASGGRYAVGAVVGVDMFFVLSGFLITALLLDEFSNRGRISLRAFYVRRGLRLFPAFAVFLLVCLAIYFRVEGDLRDLMGRFLVANGLYFANIAESTGHHLYWAHTWTLSAEEQFYLLWPAALIVLFRLRLSRPQIVGATVGLALLSSVLRYVLWNHGPYQENIDFAYYNPATHADSLLLGCALGQLYAWNLLPSSGRARRILYWLAIASGAALAVFTGFGHPQSPLLFEGGLVLVVVASAVFFIGCFDDKPRWPFRVFRWRPLAYVGEISYGLYLWNPVFLFNYPGTAFPPLVGVACAFAVAIVSFHVVEVPALRLKPRFTPVPHQRPVVVEPAPLPPGTRTATSPTSTTSRANTSHDAVASNASARSQ
jgi:peptidoglycan/LPS O-acetylase OafA/YrhL